jgi:hypothetical protein
MVTDTRRPATKRALFVWASRPGIFHSLIPALLFATLLHTPRRPTWHLSRARLYNFALLVSSTVAAVTV